MRSTGKTVQNSVISVTDDCIVTFIPRAFCQPLGLGLESRLTLGQTTYWCVERHVCRKEFKSKVQVVEVSPEATLPLCSSE